MNDHTHTLQQRERIRQGMLCMYRERLRWYREEFMAASRSGNAEYMHELTKEMASLLRASLVLITEVPDVRRHPHLRLLPHP